MQGKTNGVQVTLAPGFNQGGGGGGETYRYMAWQGGCLGVLQRLESVCMYQGIGGVGVGGGVPLLSFVHSPVGFRCNTTLNKEELTAMPPLCVYIPV